MKKMGVLMALVMLVFSIVAVSAQQGIHEPGTGIDNPEVKAIGTGQGLNDSNENNGGEGQQKVEDKVEQTVRQRLKTGNYVSENGKQIRVEARENNRFKLESNGMAAETGLKMSQEMVGNRTMLKANLSNGRNAEIKIMPDTASERALERLRLKVCSEENGCQIELKETGKGEEIRAVYEVKAQKQAKVFGLFKARMKVNAEVDAETGEVIKSKRPWWAFLATESEE